VTDDATDTRTSPRVDDNPDDLIGRIVEVRFKNGGRGHLRVTRATDARVTGVLEWHSQEARVGYELTVSRRRCVVRLGEPRRAHTVTDMLRAPFTLKSPYER
jgi:hypothetical protein